MKRKKKIVLILLSYLSAKVVATVHEKGLVKMKRH